MQTGANFGLDQVHDNPFLCDIGSGTMVSDGLAMGNIEMSSTSFKIGKVTISENNYLGNNIYVPSANRMGANCLLATKVLVPIDGSTRENTGLLGSPSFEIPRIVDRDQELAAMDEAQLKQPLGKKNRYNLVTMAAYLFCNWLLFFTVLLLLCTSILLYPHYGAWSLAGFSHLAGLFIFGYFVMMEKLSLGFGRLQAKTVTMYDDYFLFHERHWKFCGHPLMSLFSGTPLKPFVSYLLGIKIGKKVFDDGAYLYDKTLIEIGDYANLNIASVVQAHSLEEGMFKSDHIKIGAGCTLQCGAFVHYGVTMGENAILGPNAFLMKGETVDPGAVWQGNPARAATRTKAALKAEAVIEQGAQHI